MLKAIKPMDIEKCSFEIITRELGDRLLDPENELVIKRVIHTTADFDYVENLRFSAHAVGKGIEALRGGCGIVTDTQMARSGINKTILAQLGGEVHCFMSDPDVARRIAVWYKLLHSHGYAYVYQQGESMYDEADFFTLENIAFIKEKTETQNAPAWALLEQYYAAINNQLCRARRTLTYNDFYCTNMVVAKDKSSALLFDYNLLGKGYAYTDVRNVLSSLSEEAGKAFLDEYGEFEPIEKALDDVVSVVVTLYRACLRDEIPWWAQALLNEMDTTFIEKMEYLQSII